MRRPPRYASAGLLVADRSSVLHVVAASSEKTDSLELFQAQRDQGPCLDCYRSGSAVTCPISKPRPADGRNSSPQPSSGAWCRCMRPDAPARSDFGTLGRFGTTVGAVNEDDLRLGQALAHVASVALLAGIAATDRDALNGQLQVALGSRVVIELAKGAIAQHVNVDRDEAFAILRSRAGTTTRRSAPSHER